MAIAFIAGGVVGGLFGAALVWAYELKVLCDFRTRVDSIEKNYYSLLSDIPQVAYICDGKACTSWDGECCHHTVDIRHARNFECVSENKYVEKEPDYQKFADEVLEMLNMYCDDGNEIYIKKRVLEVNMKSILKDWEDGKFNITDACDETSD